MINALYVGGNKTGIPEISESNIHLDYVQNGMIALSVVQSGDFDAIIIEDQLPLMTPTRLLQELTKINSSIPIISITRSIERKKQLLQDYKIGLFGYFDPDNYKIEELIDLLKHAKNLRDFRKELPKTAVRHFSGVGFEKVVGISKEMLKVYHLMCQIKSKDVTTILYGESGTGKI